MSTDNERYQASKKVTLVGMLVNTTLAIVKMVIGILGRSPALFADGVHSLSDLISDVLVLVAAKHASKEADFDHPYGHERIETLATVVLSIILIVVGVLISYHALANWIRGELLTPDSWTIYAAVFSILANEGLYRYTMKVANQVDSDLLRANAWHSRSDMYSSVIVLIGLIGALLGVTWMDAVAAVIVSYMIVKLGVIWSYKALSELVDMGVDSETLQNIEEIIAKTDGVKHFHCLRTRKMAGKILLDVHVLVDAHITASEGHYIAELVRGRLSSQIEDIKDITVHIDVYEHPEQFVSPKDMPPSRKTIVREVNNYLDQQGINVKLCHNQLFAYYYLKEIELYFLLMKNQSQIMDVDFSGLKLDKVSSLKVKCFINQ